MGAAILLIILEPLPFYEAKQTRRSCLPCIRQFSIFQVNDRDRQRLVVFG